MNDAPTVLSLFAGVGGFDLGLERAGLRCVGQVELDPFCQRVLGERWPGVFLRGDVRRIGTGLVDSTSNDLTRGRGESPIAPEFIDLLVGGFPCQDFSVAGRRAGLDGYRGTLFWEIVRIAKDLRPTWGLFENVPGLISSRAGRDFWAVLQGLRECWPAVGWRVLDSQHFGVPQRRRRVYLVGGPSEAGVAQVLALTEGGGGDSPARGAAGADVACPLAAGAGGSKFGSGRDAQDTFVIANTVRAADGHHGHSSPRGDGCDNLVVAFDPTTSLDQATNPNTSPPLKVGTGLETMPWSPAVLVADPTQMTSAKNYSNPKPGDPCHPLPAHGHPPLMATMNSGENAGAVAFSWQQGEDSRHGKDGRGRSWVVRAGDYAAGLSASRHDAIATSASIRRLTPLECERLQAFPDGWTCLCQPLDDYRDDPDAAALACRCPDGPRYRAMGNAVTVTVIEWLGRRLMEAIR